MEPEANWEAQRHRRDGQQDVNRAGKATARPEDAGGKKDARAKWRNVQDGQKGGALTKKQHREVQQEEVKGGKDGGSREKLKGGEAEATRARKPKRGPKTKTKREKEGG